MKTYKLFAFIFSIYPLNLVNPSRQLTDQSQQQKKCNKKWNEFKFNNKKTRTTSTVSLLLTLSLTLRILVPLFLISNIFHILHDLKYAKIRDLY